MRKILTGTSTLLFVMTMHAAPREITCSYKWDNSHAFQNEFSFQVESLGTSKAKVLVTPNDDGEMLQVITGVKNSDHEADIMLREVGIEYPAEVYTSAKEDILIEIRDGVSTEIFIKLFKNSNYTSGFITV